MGSLAAEVLDRTRRGAAALAEAVRATRSEPERAGYLVAGGLAVGARLLWQRSVGTTLRLALPPMLAGAVLRSSTARGDKAVLLAGLGAGWVGERAKTRTPAAPSLLGVAGVTGQYLAYSGVLIGRGARMSPMGSPVESLLRLAGWGAGISVAAGRARRATAGSLTPAATIAGLAVSTTAALAQDQSLQTGPVARQGLDHGGNLVLVSEGLTLLRAAVCQKDDLAGRVLDAGSTGVGVLGHLLLVDGLVRR